MMPDAPVMPTMMRSGVPLFVATIALEAAHGRIRLDAAAAARLVGRVALHPFAARRLLGVAVPFLGPVAKRVAVPRRLRRKLRQAETFPQPLCVLHVFLLWQRERRHWRFLCPVG